MTNFDRGMFLDSKGKREVILVFPGKFKAFDPQIPLALLYLANPLVEAGYKVHIIDMRVEKYRDFNLGEPVFVGISCMSGLQIHYGLKFASRVRHEKPGCPLVWGGVHPTLLPEQTAANNYVDLVVRGEAEGVVVELANKLSEGKSIADVAGITYKGQNTIDSNFDSDVIDLNSVSEKLPYELLRLDRYPSLRAGRFHMQTSRGCPHRCSFCYGLSFNKGKWRGKSPRRVLDEVEYVLNRFPQIRILDIIDDNFFVDQRRVEEICQGILERGIEINWRAHCRFDYLASYDEKFISLLERSGCVELNLGGESGSDRLLTYMHKDVSRDQMLCSVRNLRRWGASIEPVVSWISGIPTETEEDLKKTLDIMDQMTQENPRTQHQAIFIYTPFPNALLSDLDAKFTPPKSLEEWSKIEVFYFKPPWHSKSYNKKLQAILAVTRYAFFPETRIEEQKWAVKIGYKSLNIIAKYRWRHRWFKWPVEMELANALAKKFKGYV